jgi:hypothetical protein
LHINIFEHGLVLDHVWLVRDGFVVLFAHYLPSPSNCAGAASFAASIDSRIG